LQGENQDPGERGRIVAVEYKVVELGMVSEEEIESALNEWVAEGWTYEGLQFAMRDSSPRPSMAFVTFKRETADSSAD
jgi:hypothetical protein